MDVVEEVVDQIRVGTPLKAISIVSEKGPEEVRKVAENLFSDPNCVSELSDEWKNLMLLVYFSHYSYMAEGREDEESISNSAVASLTAAKLCRRLGIPDLEARFLISGGRAIYKMRMKDKAEKIFREAEKILRELLKNEDSKEIKAMLARVLNELSVLYMDMDRKEDAEKYLIESLNLRRDVGDKEDIAESLYNAGTYYMRAKRLEIAEGYYKECEELLWELSKEREENLPKLGMLLNNMGVLYRKMGKFEEAEKYHREALEIFDRLSKEDERWKKYVADTFGYIGTMYNDMMMFDDAAKYYEVAKQMYSELERKMVDDSSSSESEKGR